ncbi:MAG TPA: right-handed parallel beta-helix repeat-containing protein [Pyrinomonadaceae bacterium]|nr:right-handed parallel beta-helix repeat-containing protein [Pyrinomonadaceae bacterium]
MHGQAKGKRGTRRLWFGGALVLLLLVASFAVYTFKLGDGSSGQTSRSTRRRETNPISYAEVRREEDPAPPPSHPVPTGGTQFYVADQGRPDGDGSKNRPWDLATALSQPARVKAGDTIWLRGGTYKGAFKSKLSGEAGRPILLAQFTNERATIDGSLIVEGAWTTYWGFEVTNSDTDRTRERPTGVEITGAHTKFINLIVHDCGNGIAFWSTAVDGELYGNIIYNNGWQSSSMERGHGHALYTQNEEGTKLIRDNIMFNQFGWGIHAYTEEGEIKGFNFEGNVSFNNGAATIEDEGYDNILVGGERPAARIMLTSNYTYETLTKTDTKPNVRLHYGATGNQDLIVRDNRFVGGSLVASVRDWQSITMTGNSFYGLQQLVTLAVPDGVKASAYNWDSNTYFQGRESEAFSFQGKSLGFAEWQRATGFDRNSQSLSNAKGRPEGVEVFVRPNQYEQGRAHVVIYNWDLKDVVEVDARGLLPLGAKYEVRAAENYFGAPIQAGTYDGKPLRLVVNNLKTAQLIGGTVRLETSAPEFAVLILLRKS